MKKRLLCSFLAVMMLISMLAGIVLPASAEEASSYTPYSVYRESNSKPASGSFAISTTDDWVKLTEDFATTSCALNLYVTNDIDFKDVADMKPLGYVANGLTGLLDGQGYTFENISITKDGSGQAAHYGVALVGSLNGGTIQNLGLTGSVTNTSAETGSKTAAFVGGKHNGNNGWIKNCWADVHVKGPSTYRSASNLAVFFAYSQDGLAVENCINYGTVETTSTGGGAAVFSSYSGINNVKNCLDLGTIVSNGSGYNGAFIAHHNNVAYITGANSYSVNNIWGWVIPSGESVPSGKTLPDGTAITSVAQVNEYYAVGSAAEAAWEATNGAEGAVYYKADAEKGVVFGTATDRVQKVTFRGLSTEVKYLNVGDTINLAEICDDVNAQFGVATKGYQDAISNGVLTVPNKDITVDVGVAYSKKADYAALSSATGWFISSKADWINLTNDFYGKTCSYTLHVTNDIDFENTNMKPLSYGSGIVAHVKLYGNGHTFENIKIEMEGGTNQYQGVALIGALANGVIYDLGVTGNIYNTSTSTSARTAVFSGGASAGNSPVIKNCWADVHVKGPSSNRAQYLAVFFATPASAHTIENCINYGTVETTSASGGASVFYPYSAQVAIKNSLDLGTIVGQGGYAGSIVSHHNGLSNFLYANSYSTGEYWAWTHPGYDSEIKGYGLTLPGTEIALETGAQAKEFLAVGSAAEAAWRATNGANGAVYYKLDAEKGVVYGAKTDRVQKVTFSGLVENVTHYLNNGATLDLAQVVTDAGVEDKVLYTITEGYETAVAGSTLTVPNADVNIHVSLDNLALAKEDLQKAYDAVKDYNPAYFNEGEALTAWKANALEAIANGDIATVNALLAANAEMTFTIKEGTYVPYSELALYSEINSANIWGISSKQDWLDLVEDYEGKNCDLTLYVTQDIDFESTNMMPLSYGVSRLFHGKLYGQGHTFKNIKIEMEGGNNQYQGVSLIGALGAGLIQDLGLTGEVTNTSTSAGSAYTAAFAAGACAGNKATIKNCWSDVTVKGPSDNRGRWLGVFYTVPHANQTIENCINYGTVQTTSEGGGAAVFYGYSANGTVKNSLDLGTVIGNGAGVVGAINSHINGLHTFINSNNYSINNFWGKTHGFGAGSATMPDGSAITSEAQVDAVFNAETATEAAWKATNGAKGEVYYKLDETGKVVYGTANDRVWRVSVTDGSVVTNYYGMEGLTVELPEAAAGKVRVVSGATVEGNTLTLGKADATVSYIDYEDSEFYAKKAALQAKIDSYDKYNSEYVGNWAAIEAWIAEAEALIADPFATDDVVAAKTKAAPAPKAAALTYPNYPSAKEYDLYRSFIKEFAIADKADWLALVENSTTKASSFNGYNFHVTNDIDFENTQMLPVGYDMYRFEGTLDGHGYVFKNLNIVASGAGTVEAGTGNTLGIGLFCDKTGGSVKNLGLASGTVTSTGNGAYIGSFAGFAKLCPITNCWSALTIKTCDGYTGKVGGFVGRGSASLAIDGCYYVGSIESDAPAYNLNGMVGYAEANKGLVKNSFVYSEGVDGISGVHTNQYGAGVDFVDPTINSYNIGGKAFDLGDKNGYDQVFVDHADAIAAFEAKYALTADAYANGVLAYKLNEGSAASGIYFTVANGKTVLGSATDKVVKITVDGVDYYAATGTKISVEVAEGNVLVVESGDAVVNGNIVTAGVEDAVITVGADDDSILAAAKQNLENLLALYNAREAKYFTDAAWTAQTEWKATAEAAIAANTLDAINAAITAEADVSKAAASLTYPNYPSIEDYAIYAGTGVKNFAIGTKAEWLALIAMTEGSLGEQFANNVTIHLTADIDMKNEAMLPVAYGGKFKAALDGHGHVFKNINISVNDSVSPVGLVGYLGGDTWISNVGIESGIINVTGTITGNVHVGSIVGQSETRSYLRKCWNAADIEVATTGVSNIGGIVGRMNSSNVIDSCYNLGDVSGYGILGYGGNSTALYNCFNLGANKGLAYYHVGVFDAASAVKGNPYVNCWNKGKLLDGVNGTVTEEIDNLRRKLNNDHYVGTAEEAAWEVNNGYVASGKGDKSRAWFTVDETGMVRFGTADGQPHKVTINFVADGQKVSEQVYFAAPGATIELNGELGASYFVVKSASTATLKGNMLTMGYEDVVIEGQCGLHMGDASADKAVNLFDAITVLRSIVGLADCGMAGDVNRNGRLDANDAVLIARYWLGDPNASFVETKPVEVNDNWIKIATYNVKVMKFDGSYSGGTPGANLADIVAVLKAADADILGLQEINSDQLEPLMTALNDEGLGYVASFFTPAKDETYGTAVISRYAITDSQVVKFADATDAEGNALEIDGAEPRSFARLVLDVNGKEVVFYNSHLANKSYTQLEYIRDNYLKADVDAGKNVIMTADFNLDHEHVQYCVHNLGITALNRNLESTVDNSYIDNILVSGNMDYYWDNTTGNGVKVIDSDASDHSLVYGYACLK